MANFYDRFRKYFENVAQALRVEAEMASIFPNTSDVGLHREFAFADFLERHSPTKSNVCLGGYLFGEDGRESKQIDIIISTDTAPQFNYLRKGKSFMPIDGCLGIVSIKSNLTKKELIDSLKNIASIPDKQPINCSPQFYLDNYEDWPYKIIYASKGISCHKIMEHISTFYWENPTDLTKIPNIIYVLNEYVIFRGMQINITEESVEPIETVEKDEYVIIDKNECIIVKKQGNPIGIKRKSNPDLVAFQCILSELQQIASSACFMKFNYNRIYDKLSNE